MIRRFAIMLLVLFVPALTAQAQVVPMECQLLPVHTAGQGKNSADYTPGVDVRGKPVVPADLGSSPSVLPRTIVVPLSVDLAERLRAVKLEGLEMNAPLGMLEIHPNGRVVYNDKDLTPQVYVACGREAIPELPAAGVKTIKTKPGAASEGDGQPGSDALESEAVEVAPVPAVPPQSELIEGGEARYEGYR